MTEFDLFYRLPSEGIYDFDNFFTIGLHRNPCDYYLSLWAFGNLGKGYLRAIHDKKGSVSLYGQDESYEPSFGSERDLNAFTLWLQNQAGALSKRATTSHGTEFDTVDCWVSTEDLNSDLQRCLDRFQTEHGGKVSGTVEEFAGSVKNNHSQRGQCSDYFDEERESIVRQHDELMFRAFNYTGCC